jgi:hypothetical protein
MGQKLAVKQQSQDMLKGQTASWDSSCKQDHSMAAIASFIVLLCFVLTVKGMYQEQDHQASGMQGTCC